MKDFSAIGQKLRELRKKKKLTLSEVATTINKSTSHIGSIERADRCPSLLSLIELAEFYKVPLASLFENDLDKYQHDIGTYLQGLLSKKDYSIADLAKKTDINYFQLADFFKGRTSLSLDQLKTIAQFLNISVKKIIPQAPRYIRYIEYYLEALGIDEESIQNIIEYIYSKFEI